MVRFFNALGTPLLSFFQYLGEVVLLAADTFRCIFAHKLRWKLFLNQVVEIGLLSQLVVVITGGFTGAVFAAKLSFNLTRSEWDRPPVQWYRSRSVASLAPSSRR